MVEAGPTHSHLVLDSLKCRRHREDETRWLLESVFDYLTNREMCIALATCAGWHVAGTQSPWARVAWIRRIPAEKSDAAELLRRHCCPRGRFLALKYAPSRQLRRTRRRLRREAEEENGAWKEERAPLESALRSARARLRVVACLCVGAAYASMPRGEATLLLLWPVRFAWHASSISRLAHDSLADYSIETFFSNDQGFSALKRELVNRWRSTWPVAHALTSPDALELRRYAFATSTVCVIVAIALLIAWWRCVWYALGSVCSELGLASFDVADCELRLKLLEQTSAHRRRIVEIRMEEDILFRERTALSVFQRQRRRRLSTPVNPYQGRDEDSFTPVHPETETTTPQTNTSSSPAWQRRLPHDCGKVLAMVASRVCRRWRTWKAKRDTRRFVEIAAELNRPLIRILAASSVFVVVALLVAVCARAPRATPRKQGDHVQIALRYAARAAMILVGAVRQDILPVCFLMVKFVASCLRMLLCRALFSHYGIIFAPVLTLSLAFASSSEDDAKARKDDNDEGRATTAALAAQ